MKTMEGLVLCSANYVPLSPISFLERAAYVYQNRVSIIYGNTKYSWKETHERCIKLASAISELGITRGDIVAAIAPNIPALYELHFGVPMAGAVLSAFNTKLTATAIALKLQQLEAKIIFVDYQFVNVVKEAFDILSETRTKPSFVVIIHETNLDSSSNHNSRELFVENVLDYDEILATGQLDFKIIQPKDECDPISVNFTSGSTGEPKGVVYSHRAAYLTSISQIFRAEMRDMPVFLWTVDMFRCNGWCFPWTMAALGGTNICLRDVTGKTIFDAIFNHKVTLFCGASGILTKIVDAIADDQQKLSHNVNVVVAGAMPPPEVRIKLESLGFRINYGYGMTEALGVVTSSPWTSIEDQANEVGDEDETIRIRKGIHNLMMEKVDVIDPITMTSLPPDGKSTGEIRFRSNTMMLGYINNLKATQEAFEGGWYRTKDLGIKHPNGFIEFKDRVIDIITCGGKSISTLNIEAVLIRHPMVLEAAVVGRPDDRLGETPCAFVKLIDKSSLTAEEIVKFCSSHLPSYMIPQTVVFQDLPVDSTGKVQKFALRDKAKAMENE